MAESCFSALALGGAWESQSRVYPTENVGQSCPFLESCMESEHSRIFGARLRIARKRRRVAVQKLADGLKVDRRTLTRWEQGTLIPSAYVMQQLGVILEVSPRWLMGFSDDPEPGEQLNAEEKAFMDGYRRLEPSGKAAMRELLSRLLASQRGSSKG